MARKSGPRTQLFDLGDVVVHQLLCGRDIANRRKAPPEDGALWRVWEFAESMRNFVYLIVDMETKEALVFDGCWDIDGIFAYAQNIGAKVTTAVFSHAHFDHAGGLIPAAQTGGIQFVVGGLKDFAQRGVPVFAGKGDVTTMVRGCQIQPGQLQVAEDGDCIPVGNTLCTLVETPGHTKGCVCLHVATSGKPGTGDKPGHMGTWVTAKEGVLLSGDTLFVQACGRTDLPESSQDEMLRSLSKLVQGLPDGCLVCPGHDYANDPYTSIANERSGNQMVNMGLQSKPTPGCLPRTLFCPCAQRGRPWQTAADFMTAPELTVSGLSGGELQLDGVPQRANMSELRRTVFEHLRKSAMEDSRLKHPRSPDEIHLSDGSGKLTDNVLISQVSEEDLMVTGVTLPRDQVRRPWFLANEQVVLIGLQSAPQLNGQAALISEWVADKGRYEVLVTAVGIRDIKHVKPDNLKRASAGVQARPPAPEGFGVNPAVASLEATEEIDDDSGQEVDEVDELWEVVFRQKVVVRAEPSVQGAILDSRKPGDQVRVCQRQGDWVRLHSSEGLGSSAWLLTNGASKGLGMLLALVQDKPAAPKPSHPAQKPSSAAAGPAKEPLAQATNRTSAGATPNRQRLLELQEELESVEMEKAAAIEDEDYDLAAELKVKKQVLEAGIQDLERSQLDDKAARLASLQEELQSVKASKLDAVEEEDFRVAASFRARQLEIEAEMLQLEAR